jgi:hypothetical protein
MGYSAVKFEVSIWKPNSMDKHKAVAALIRESSRSHSSAAVWIALQTTSSVLTSISSNSGISREYH